MNDVGREKLISAALSGVKQIKGNFRDNKDGRCALGVLGAGEGDLMSLLAEYGINHNSYDFPRSCELCTGEYGRVIGSEAWLITHYNDAHDMDFLTIARKI